VLIGNSSFRIGDTKFVLTGSGKAAVANAVTDPTTGNTSLVKGNACPELSVARPQALKYAICVVVASRRPEGDHNSLGWSA